MRGRNRGVHCYGPYKHGRKWRVRVSEDGDRDTRTFITFEAATQYANAIKKQSVGRIGVAEVMLQYEQHQRAKGNKPGSIDTVGFRLRAWFDRDASISDYTKTRLEEIYKQRQASASVDTHQRELATVKTFYRWMVQERIIQGNPAEEIQPVGRRNHGKTQLRRAEAQRLVDLATKQAQAGDDSALAILAILLLGLRASELLLRTKRDLDRALDCTLLWIDSGKTKNAKRHIAIPEPLAGLMVAYARNVEPEARLFPHSKNWLWSNCRRLCELAGVTVVSPHGLRGTWATLATELGIETNLIAKALGHSSYAVTRAHYAEKGSEQRAQVDTVIRTLNFGIKTPDFDPKTNKTPRNSQSEGFNTEGLGFENRKKNKKSNG